MFWKYMKKGGLLSRGKYLTYFSFYISDSLKIAKSETDTLFEILSANKFQLAFWIFFLLNEPQSRSFEIIF
jgi:hypothetical protein